MNHLIRITHHDTGAVDFYCGESQPNPSDGDASKQLCSDCIVAALSSERRIYDEAIQRIADAVNGNADVSKRDRETNLTRHDGVTLRLHLLERRMDKAERMAAKKGGRR